MGDSIDRDVLGRNASRSLSSQPEGNIETVIISSDSEPSGNSETTNRNETTQDPLSVSFSPLMFESQPNETSNVGTQSGEPSENSEPTTQVFYCCHTGRPLIFESQYSESSNIGTQSQEPSENSETTTQDPNVASPLKFESQYSESSNVGTQSEDPKKCRQNFATESDTQCKFVLVCPEDADESTENADETTEKVDESTENADETTENVDESTENADVSSDTVIFETSDFNTNTDLVSSADSEHSDYTENTQTLSQYVKGPDTQDNSPEITQIPFHSLQN